MADERRSIILDIQIKRDKARQQLEANKKAIEDNTKAIEDLKEEYKDEKDLTKFNQALKELNKSTRELKAENRKLEKELQIEKGSINELKKALKTAKEERDKLGDATGENAQRIRELNVEIAQYSQQIKDATTSTEKSTQAQDKNAQATDKQAKSAQKLTKRQKLVKRLADAERDSVEELRAKLALLTDKRNNLGDINGKNAKTFNTLQKAINNANDELKEIEETGGDFRRSVGDYGKALRDVPLDSFSIEVGGLSVGLKDLQEGFKLARIGAISLQQAIIATGIGAVVIAVVALASAFAKTEAGGKKLSRILAGLGAVFDVIVGAVGQLANDIFDFFVNFEGEASGFTVFIQDIANGFVDAFTNPIETVEALFNVLFDNLKNRVEGVFNSITALSSGAVALIKGDFDGAKKSAEEYGKATVQAFTGLDTQQQGAVINGVKNGIEATGEALTSAGEGAVDFGKKLGDAFTGGQQFEGLRQQLERFRREEELNIKQLEDTRNLLRDIGEDDTLGFKERNKANLEALKIEEQVGKRRVALAEGNFKNVKAIADAQREAGIVQSTLTEEEAEALKELQDARAESAEQERDIAERRRRLVQDTIERNLDFAIETLNSQQSVNDLIIDDENRTQEERQKALNSTKALAVQTYETLSTEVEKFTDGQVDLAQLSQITDQKTLRDKIRGLELSEIAEGRLLEAITLRRETDAKLAKQQKDLDLSEVTRKNELASSRIQNEKLIAENEANQVIQTVEERNFKLAQIEAEFRLKELEQERLFLEEQLALKVKAGEDTANIREAIAQKEAQINQASIASQKSLIQAENDLQKSRVEVAESTTAGLSKLAQSFLGESEEAVKAKAVISGTEALVNSFLSASQALTAVPFPANIGAFATSLATGISAVVGISNAVGGTGVTANAGEATAIQQQNAQAQAQNTQNLGLQSALQNIPQPVVQVSDIQTALNNQATVTDTTTV